MAILIRPSNFVYKLSTLYDKTLAMKLLMPVLHKNPSERRGGKERRRGGRDRGARRRGAQKREDGRKKESRLQNCKRASIWLDDQTIFCANDWR